jgi:hypothetical protein
LCFILLATAVMTFVVVLERSARSKTFAWGEKKTGYKEVGTREVWMFRIKSPFAIRKNCNVMSH